MCELLGVTAKRKIIMNDLLATFFSHSVDHRNGWGLAVLDTDPVTIDREPVMASSSLYLKDRLLGTIETSKCIGHIRFATIGGDSIKNTHPFARYDISGRQWVLAHNGTIFDYPPLNPYIQKQVGDTDSERVFLFLMDRLNAAQERKGSRLVFEERFELFDNIICDMAKGNKLNLLFSDGKYLYAHTNCRGTLYYLTKNNATILSTHPLSEEAW